MPSPSFPPLFIPNRSRSLSAKVVLAELQNPPQTQAAFWRDWNLWKYHRQCWYLTELYYQSNSQEKTLKNSHCLHLRTTALAIGTRTRRADTSFLCTFLRESHHDRLKYVQFPRHCNVTDHARTRAQALRLASHLSATLDEMQHNLPTLSFSSPSHNWLLWALLIP